MQNFIALTNYYNDVVLMPADQIKCFDKSKAVSNGGTKTAINGNTQDLGSVFVDYGFTK